MNHTSPCLANWESCLYRCIQVEGTGTGTSSQGFHLLPSSSPSGPPFLVSPFVRVHFVYLCFYIACVWPICLYIYMFLLLHIYIFTHSSTIVSLHHCITVPRTVARSRMDERKRERERRSAYATGYAARQKPVLYCRIRGRGVEQAL